MPVYSSSSVIAPSAWVPMLRVPCSAPDYLETTCSIVRPMVFLSPQCPALGGVVGRHQEAIPCITRGCSLERKGQEGDGGSEGRPPPGLWVLLGLPTPPMSCTWRMKLANGPCFGGDMGARSLSLCLTTSVLGPCMCCPWDKGKRRVWPHV